MVERYLGIEVTPLHIRLIEMSPTAPPKVHNFFSANLFSAHSENVSQQLSSAISNTNIKARKARIAMSETLTHRVFALPPIPEKELDILVGKEVKNILPATQTQETVFDWQIIGDDEGGKKSVLTAVVLSSEVRKQAGFVDAVGFSPDLITTIPCALYNSLKLIEGIHSKPSVLLHFGGLKIYAIFMRKGKWVFHREFEQDPNSRGVPWQEIIRTFLYYQQLFKGEAVEKIIVSGSVTAEIEKACSEVFKIQVERFSPALDLSPLKGRSEEFRQVISEYALSIGLTSNATKDCINLVLPEITKKIRAKIINKCAVMGLAFIIVIMGISYWRLLSAVSCCERVYLKKKQELASLEPYLAAKKKQDIYRENQSLLWNIDNHSAWMETLRELNRIIAPEMVFQNLSMKRDGEKVAINIKGGVFTADNTAGLEIINRFYSQLTTSLFFTKLAINPDNIIFTQPNDAEGSNTAHLSFEISGELSPLEIEYE
ncbi:MAG: hypothetical protein A2W17_11590 [Planctomycetes bacterium RBG_16_41_13]|nr:MAG: hypothetical protein A2W17_11590 [Planctomycetes bacterium RBG_16_41_13]